MLIQGTMTDVKGRMTEFEVDAFANRQVPTGRASEAPDLTRQGRILWAIQGMLAEYEEGDL